MKLRNREINIFSMSALDLFASAMGAFMFLAIMSLPFFPHTGNSQENIDEIKEKLAKAQQKNDELEKKISEEKSTAKISFPSMDIVIALDTTASMSKQIDGLQGEIVQLAELIMKLSPDAAMGVIDFKDRCMPNPIRTYPITKLSKSSMSGLQQFADGMHAMSGDCNIDQEEAVDMAMTTAMDMKWLASAKDKIIILITDNGAYPDKIKEVKSNAVAFHQRCEKCQVSTVFVPTDKALGEDFLKEISHLGGGKFVTGGGSFTATILLTLAE